MASQGGQNVEAPPYDAVIFVDGAPAKARRGANLAAALWSAGYVALRRSPRRSAPRGAFCMIGVCQECRVSVDGRVAQACLTEVVDGMRVSLGLCQ